MSLIASIAIAASLAATPALSAAPLTPAGTTVEQAPSIPGKGRIITVAGDCYAVGEQVAASEGGTLVKAMPQNQGGRAVCVIVYTVPAPDGGRPQRRQVVVDQ